MEWDKDRVRNIRKALRLTQMEFAHKLGCRQQTVSEWEQGIYQPANAYGRLLDMLEREMNLSASLQNREANNFAPTAGTPAVSDRNGVTPKTVTTFSLPRVEVPDIFKDELSRKPFDPALD